MYCYSALRRTVHIVATEYLVYDSTFCTRFNSFIQINGYIATCRSCLADRNLLFFRSALRISDVINATLTTTEHTAEVVILSSIFRINDLRTYCTTVDIHRRILCNSANLTTAIDTALHSSTSHVQCGSLTLTEFWPQWKQCSIQSIETSHTACKHITTLGILQMVLIVKCCIWYHSLLLSSRIVDVLIVVTDSTAADVYCDVTTTFIIIGRSVLSTWVRIRAIILIVWTQDTVWLYHFPSFFNLFIHQIETVAY